MSIRSIALACLSLATLCLLGGFATASRAQDAAAASPEITDSYRKAIRKYIAVQGSAEMTGQSIAYSIADQTLMAIAQTGVEITQPMQQIVLEESLETFGTKFADVDFLAQLYTPVYAAHFDESEIREIIAFYESPVGRKTIELMGPLSQAGNTALQEATFAVMPGFQLAVDARLREAGILPGPGGAGTPAAP